MRHIDAFAVKILAQHKAKGEEDQALEADAVKKANKAKRKAAAKPAPLRKQAPRKGKSLESFPFALSLCTKRLLQVVASSSRRVNQMMNWRARVKHRTKLLPYVLVR